MVRETLKSNISEINFENSVDALMRGCVDALQVCPSGMISVLIKQEAHPIRIPPIMSYASDAGGLAHVRCPAASIQTAEIPDQVRNDGKTTYRKKRYFFLAWERNIVYNGNRKDAVTTVPAPY